MNLYYIDLYVSVSPKVDSIKSGRFFAYTGRRSLRTPRNEMWSFKYDAQVMVF